MQGDGILQISGYDLWLVHTYRVAEERYLAWRVTWDLTEEQDFIYGYADRG